MAIERILVATDGSTTAQAGLAWATGLAASLGAEVLVLSVIGTADVYPGALYFPDETEIRDRLDAELEGAWSEPMREAHVAFRTLARDGDPAAVIVESASAEKADLVVVGSRGHGALGQLLAHSVSHHVTHHAAVPVVIVAPGAVPVVRMAQADPADCGRLIRLICS